MMMMMMMLSMRMLLPVGPAGSGTTRTGDVMFPHLGMCELIAILRCIKRTPATSLTHMGTCSGGSKASQWPTMVSHRERNGAVMFPWSMGPNSMSIFLMHHKSLVSVGSYRYSAIDVTSMPTPRASAPQHGDPLMFCSPCK